MALSTAPATQAQSTLLTLSLQALAHSPPACLPSHRGQGLRYCKAEGLRELGMPEWNFGAGRRSVESSANTFPGLSVPFAVAVGRLILE